MEPSLDQLIGDLRAEASRRRAAPDFPIDVEAEVVAEMDREGPAGGAVDLGAAAAAVDALIPGLEGSVAELAGLTASALRSLAVRLGQLERQASRVPERQAVRPAGSSSLGHWIPSVSAASEGRVLVVGAGCAPWVTALEQAGADVYGLDPSAEEFSDDGPVRAGSVLDHLETVGSLGTVVLVGAVRVSELGVLDRWMSELRRTTRLVLAVSETPWSWRLRVGPRESDTADWRPLSADTWIELFAGATYEVKADYSRGGLDYFVSAKTGS